MESAWTRDGRIKADVINISADVAGTVIEVKVHDNQLVKQGDVLFVVDKARYQSVLAQANAQLASAAGGKRPPQQGGQPAAQAWTTPSSRPKAARRPNSRSARRRPSTRRRWPRAAWRS